MQILKDGSNNYTLYIRYGRIGVDGTIISKPHGSAPVSAVNEYSKILRSKLNYGYTHV